MVSAFPLAVPSEEHGQIAALAREGVHWTRIIALKKVSMLCRHQPGGGGPAVCARLQAAALWWPGCFKKAAESPQHRARQQGDEDWGAGAA